MKLVLFLGWVLLIFVCSDLVGRALRSRLSSWPRDPAPNLRHAHGTGDGDASVEFAGSTLLGFATLWVGLSVAYAIGIATQGLIVAFVGLAAVGAALVQRRQVLGWARSRVTLWGLVGAVAVLASFVTPAINAYDDPEYLLFIDKLLRTGSVVEYFSSRRSSTLGGWSFIQAIFSAGPAGLAFVASIDAIIGSILFLLAAMLLGTGALTALPAALIGALVMQSFQFQINLGTAFGMAGLCAVLAGLSLPGASPRHSFTPIALAVMALTVRPQLGLVALTGLVVALCRHRARSLLIAGGLLVGLSTLWVAIFLRDTSVLPLAMTPGVNPQIIEQIGDPLLYQTSLAAQIRRLLRIRWAVFSLTVLPVVICAWQSVTAKNGSAIRTEYRILAAFSIAALATVLTMASVLGFLTTSHQRYYMPLVIGLLFAFLIRSGVHIFRRAPGRLSRYASLRLAVIIILPCMLLVVGVKRLSKPTESPGRICSRLLTPEERRAVEDVPSGSGLTLLSIDCPIGSFDVSSRVMMNGLFFTTRGDYFDIAWGSAETVAWLRKREVDQLVYLDKDTSRSFGLELSRADLEILKVFSSDAGLWRRRRESYKVKSLERLRKLADFCESRRIPILDPQGPLVMVHVRQCKGGH